MKKNQAIRMKRNLSLLLVLIMLTTPLCQLKVNASQEVAIPQNVGAVSAGDVSVSRDVSNKSFDVEMQIDSRWDGGYNATVIINNTGDTVIDNWHLQFFSKDIIQNIWNASVFNYEEGIYTIKNAQHNQDIAAGESVSFGFTATCEDEVLRPEIYVMPVGKSLVKEASYACEYSVNNDMTESFYNATFSICNLTEESIEDWIVEFDFAGTIDTIWNGEIIGNEGNHYIIKNAVHNQNITGNSIVSFGFNGKKQEGNSPKPEKIRLYQINYNGTQSEDDAPNGDVSGGNVSDGDVSSGDVFSEDVDTDGDGIMDAVEARLGFDVYSPDTDKDGLPDGYELYTLYPILLKSGYDESAGINAEDDYDRDGLTNLEEYQAETNPGNEDTDGDSIRDYEELRNFGTNPILFDTDNDGLNDGLELNQGMNPLNTDSDEDGIPDGEEILNQQLVFGEAKENILEEVGVLPMLSITGKGDYSQKIEIVDISHNVKYKNTGFVVGHPYDFRHDEDLTFEDAVLSFQLSEEILNTNNIEDLAVAWYDEENNRVQILDTTYDAKNRTISAKPEHFSNYMVTNTAAYQSNLESVDTFMPTQGEIYNGHRYVLIDESMSWIEAVDYCNTLGGYLVTIGDRQEQEFLTELLKKQGKKNTYFIGLSGDGNRYTWVDGTSLTYENWDTGEPNNSTETVVHMYAKDPSFPGETELIGKWNDTYNYVSSGAPIFYYTQNCGIICEFSETAGGACVILLSDGTIVVLDANPALGDETVDTDGDGIPDIVELGIQTEYEGETYGREGIKAWTYRSNPAVADTDGDGFTDNNDPLPLEYTITLQEIYGDNVIKLNTGAVWCVFGMDIDDFYEQYYTRYLSLSTKEILESYKEMLEHNQDRVYTLDELVFINNIDLNGMKDYMQTKSLKFKSEVYNKVMGQECSIFEAWNYYRVVTPIEAIIKYRQVMYMQMLKGKYAEEGNLAGTLGELGLAFTGFDVFQDLRDLSYDVIYWETDWEHFWGTVGDAVGLVPVVGILSKSDEILAVIKRGDSILELRKLKYAQEIIESLKELKYITKAQELANTAGNMLQNFGVNLYRNILNICEGVPNYRLAYAMAGSYDNPVISALSKNADDLKYLESVDEDLVEEVVWEVAGSGSRNADELEALTEEAVEKAKKKAGDIVEGGSPTLSGQWQVVNESMSDFSRAYQKQITGQEGMAWVQNGVKFDGMKDGVLLDAKGKYAQFINPNTGEFYGWFTGKQDLLDEAARQIKASEGAKIQWYFAEEEALDVVQDLFMDNGITEIELIFEAPK